MARTTNESTQAAKRNAILDVAQRLVFTKGYAQMTIQDLLDELQISKGAFYHYFDSKTDVLNALVARTQERIEALLLPIARDECKTALEKFRLFFPVIARWKVAQKDYLVELARVLYSDDNAIFRQKTRARSLAILAPLLTEIIRQGVAEGVVKTAYPDQIGMVVVSLVLDLGESLASMLLSHNWLDREGVGAFVSLVGAYNDALERSLGVPDGSLPLMDADPNILSEWMASSWGGSSIAKFDLEVEPLSQQKTEKGGNSSISTGGMQSGPSRTAKL